MSLVGQLPIDLVLIHHQRSVVLLPGRVVVHAVSLRARKPGVHLLLFLFLLLKLSAQRKLASLKRPQLGLDLRNVPPY